MMPGSSFLNVLAGSLFGTAAAIPLVAVISTVGASGSYLLSRLVVKVSLFRLTHHLMHVRAAAPTALVAVMSNAGASRGCPPSRVSLKVSLPT